MVAPKRKISAVITLFVVAPMVAEYLLGDLPLKLLPALIVLAPAYGGGAVLIRDVARRAGRGWPTMLLLGVAYTLIAEGLVTQSLFNHDYLKMQMHLLDAAYLPALGIGGWWTLFMVNLHMFWSMGVSIVLVEALYPAEADAPWMGCVGDAVVAVLFGLGSVANFAFGFKQNQFVGLHVQLLSVCVLFVAVVLSAFLLPAGVRHAVAGAVPSAWGIGVMAFLLGLGVMSTPPKWGWGACAALLAIDAVFLCVVWILSRRTAWSALHVFSLGAGGAVAYGVHAFLQKPLLPGGLLWARIGNGVFLAAALGVIGVGAKRVSRFAAGRSAESLKV
ncbi:MAG: hypothetical protein M3O31_15815 [Acidobacteriota bacterium]|nr:hypothetical protein [Acidobacteriota bacterium]